MTTYVTSIGLVYLYRTFGPERSRVNYKIRADNTGQHIGTVSRVPPWGVKWEIIGDAAGRTFQTRRAAIEALQREAGK